MMNTTLFGIAFLLYVLALVANIIVLVRSSRNLEKTGFALFLAAFLLHTIALFVRWGEAGSVEVSALEAVEKRVLVGMEWFEVWISHPPWSNLYESLVCFGWGVALVTLYAIRRFKIPLLGLFAIGFELIVMGAASLLVNQEITPLVPALQSKWLHLHVSMATICYPAFGLAGFLGVFYLVKSGVKTPIFALIVALSSLVILLVAGGEALWLRFEYGLTPLMTHMGKALPLTYAAFDASGQVLANDRALRFSIPGAGPALLISIVAFATALILSILERRDDGTRSLNFFMGLGVVSLTLVLTLILAATFSGPFHVTDETAQTIASLSHPNMAHFELHGHGPFAFSLKGNPFEFLLLLTAWLNGIFYFVLAWKRQWLMAQLPEPERLDDLSYKCILFAFPFLTLLIITGAVWAYYAWGRYWGWDPKETWSLVTWIVYSIYLHVRVTHGWEGRLPAALAALGFAVVIFTYLGVNILLSGLHSYASG